MCVVHVIVVVADTTRSLTCHTRSSSNPPSRSSPPCSSSASILARQAHALPTCATAIFLPSSLLLRPLHSPLFHSPRFLHPATLHRHASGDTRGPTQVMHGPPYIFDPLFGLFFPTGSNVRCRPRRFSHNLSSFLSTSAHVSLSLRAVARWKDHNCPRLSFALSASRSLHCDCIQDTMVAPSEYLRSIHRNTPPVIVYLLL